jgi:hypothetical protein
VWKATTFSTQEFGTVGRGFLYDSPDGMDKGEIFSWFDKMVSLFVWENLIYRFGSVYYDLGTVYKRFMRDSNEADLKHRIFLKQRARRP